jgi:hypothetical protein
MAKAVYRTVSENAELRSAPAPNAGELSRISEGINYLLACGRNDLMKYLAIVLFVALSSFSSFAQNSETYSNCMKRANAQSEMNVCANEEAVRVEAELNEIYHKLLSKVASTYLV